MTFLRTKLERLEMKLRDLIAVLSAGAAVTVWKCTKFANGHGLYYLGPEYGDIIIFSGSGLTSLGLVIAYFATKFRNDK